MHLLCDGSEEDSETYLLMLRYVCGKSGSLISNYGSERGDIWSKDRCQHVAVRERNVAENVLIFVYSSVLQYR